MYLRHQHSIDEGATGMNSKTEIERAQVTAVLKLLSSVRTGERPVWGPEGQLIAPVRITAVGA